MPDDTSNNQSSSSNNEQPVQPVLPQIPATTVREFINIDTAENSRLNKGGENDFGVKSNAKTEE